MRENAHLFGCRILLTGFISNCVLVLSGSIIRPHSENRRRLGATKKKADSPNSSQQISLTGFAGIITMQRALNIRVWLWFVLLSVLASSSSTSVASAQEISAAQLMQSAQTSLERGDLPSAAKQLERALALDAGHKAARVALGHVLIRLQRWPEAEIQVRKLRQGFPEAAEPLYLAALVAFGRGDMEQVCELSEQVLVRGDKRAEVYKLLALAEYLLQRLDKFEAHIRTVLKLNPLDADAHYYLGRYFFEDKRYSEALAEFQAALKAQPQHYKAHYYAGLGYEGQNEGERAKEAFQASIQIIERQQLRYAWPFTDLGKLLVNEGDYERGLGWLYRAVRNDPASPHARYYYAKALFQKEPSAEVKQVVQEAIRLDPGYSEAYYLLARYYQRIGEKQLAKETFAKFEELKKNPVPSPYGLRRW
jgi:tetratricopeptide (TPR) repeat protein